MGWETVAYLAIAAAGVAVAADQPKPPKPKTPGPLPVEAEGLDVGTRKKRRKMPQSAQVFKDDELRLGSAGRLGL